jgi:predicted DNA-binding ribbon-helix-helix protein
MAESKIVNKSPQIGVRFPPEQMERLREHAERHYAGNVSTLVKVAVMRFIDQSRDASEQSKETVAA